MMGVFGAEGGVYSGAGDDRDRYRGSDDDQSDEDIQTHEDIRDEKQGGAGCSLRVATTVVFEISVRDTEAAVCAAANIGSRATVALPKPGSRRYSVTRASHSGGGSAMDGSSAMMDSSFGEFSVSSSNSGSSWSDDAFFGETSGEASAMGSILHELQQGLELLKHGGAGRPKQRWVWFDAGSAAVRWAASREAMDTAIDAAAGESQNGGKNRGRSNGSMTGNCGASPTKRGGLRVKVRAGLRRARTSDKSKSPSSPSSPAAGAGSTNGYYEMKLAELSAIHCGTRSGVRGSKSATRRRFMLVR
jgi:hypothetical protein